MTIENTDIQERPWYLRKSWLYVMCLLLFPLGLIIVLRHRNYLHLDERRAYIGIIIISSFFWALGLLPYYLSGPVFALVLVSLMIIGVAQLVRN